MLPQSFKVAMVTLAVCTLTKCTEVHLYDEQPGCPELPPLTDGFYLSLQDSYYLGDVIIWICNSSYHSVSPDGDFGSLVCMHDGTWSIPDPVCPSTTCSHPGPIQHGGYLFQNGSEYTTGEVTVGKNVYVYCKAAGYLPLYLKNTCHLNGRWKFQGVCKKACPLLTAYGGFYKYSAKHKSSWSGNLPGSTAKLICSDDFSVSGGDTLYCDDSGDWQGERGTCVPTCRAPHIPHGTIVDESGQTAELFDVGQFVTLTCDAGYDVDLNNASMIIRCLSNHTWQGELLHCTAMPIAHGTSALVIASTAIGALLLLGVVAVLLVFFHRRRKLPRCFGAAGDADKGPPTSTFGQLSTPTGGPTTSDVETSKYVNSASRLPVYVNTARTTTKYSETSENRTAPTTITVYEDIISKQETEEYVYARLHADKHI